MPILIKNLAVSMAVSTIAINGAAVKLNAITTAIPYEGRSTFQKSEPAPIDLWLNRLVRKESGGNDSLKHLDSNGEYSYGCLQYQMQTFIEYGNKYQLFTGAQIEDLEKFVYNCGFEKQLAKLMIEDDYQNWRHWYTSVVGKGGVGLPPRNIELKLVSR